LKPADVLLDDSFELKIAHFRLSTIVEFRRSLRQNKNHGTSQFIALEIHVSSELSLKVDVYAFGILVYTIVTGLKSFSGTTASFALAPKRTECERTPIPN
jgi:hypothetical protein